MKRTLFLWIFIIISYTGISKPIDSLIVEQGGGIVGQSTGYKITQNCIYKVSYRLNRLVQAGQSQKVNVSSKKLKKIYKDAKILLEKKEGFDNPGNLYKSVTIYLKDKKVTYKWGDTSFEVPADVKNLYDQVLNLIKELNFQ